MKKIRLPQPYAQMVVCGAIRSIPNVFQSPIVNSEKVYVYADYFESEWLEGFDNENLLHQRVWNEAFLGNVPDEFYPYDCFVGYVIVSKSQADDRWISNCDRYLQYLRVKSAYEFEESAYVEEFNSAYDVLEKAKINNKELGRMARDGSRLYVPVGNHTWELLQHHSTAKDLFLFWEKYMATIVPPLYLPDEHETEEIDNVVFRHNGQEKRFFCDYAGWSIKSPNFIFAFDLELELDDTNIVSKPLIEYTQTQLAEDDYSDHNASDDDFCNCRSNCPDDSQFKNPWPRFISTPMGGLNKRYK